MRWNCPQLSGKARPAIQSTRLEAGTVGTRPSQHIYFLSALPLVRAFPWIGVRRWWQLLAPDGASVIFLVQTPPKSIPVPLQQRHCPCPQTLCSSISADRGLRATAWKSQVVWLGNRSSASSPLSHHELLALGRPCKHWSPAIQGKEHLPTYPTGWLCVSSAEKPVRGCWRHSVLDKYRVMA